LVAELSAQEADQSQAVLNNFSLKMVPSSTPEFEALVAKHGIKGIESSTLRSLAKKAGYKYQDGTLLDLGCLYHQTYGAQLSLLLHGGLQAGYSILS
jgi:hypothetical protein